MAFLYIKAIHLIFVVSWFAALFYIVRLFIYHIEAQERPEAERKVLQDQYKIMEWRLWYIIATPAMILTVASGTAMFLIPNAQPYLQYSWMHVKLGFVVLLLAYHFYCQFILGKLQKDEVTGTSIRWRMWNEVATLLLVAIVFTVVLKSTSQWIWGAGGLIALGLLFMIIIKLVNKGKK